MSFRSENLASFPSKLLSTPVITSCSRKFSTLTFVEITTSTRTHFTLQAIVKLVKANALCIKTKIDCRYNNSNCKPIGSGHCPNEMCSGKLGMQKRLSNLSTEVIIIVLIARPYVRSAKLHLKNKQNQFFYMSTKDSHFRRDSKNIPRRHWRYRLSWQFFLMENLNWCLRGMLSLVVCSKCFFMVTGTSWNNNNRKKTYFFSPKIKRWTFCVTGKCYLMYHFKQPKLRKKMSSIYV